MKRRATFVALALGIRVDNGVVIIDLSPGGLPGQGPSTTSASTTVLVTGRLPTTTTGS